MEKHTALIVDIKKSRKYTLARRELLQDLIASSIDFLNAQFESGIEKAVVFSGGDEIQGLFRDSTTAFLYFRFLTFLVRPGVLRGGFGKGTWDIRIEQGSSTMQDGEAYHCARKAIAAANSGKIYDAVFCSSDTVQDDFVTIFMDHSLGIGKMRTAAQNDTSLVVELLRPLVLDGVTSNKYSFSERAVLATKLSKSLLSHRKSVSGVARKQSLLDSVLANGFLEKTLEDLIFSKRIDSLSLKSDMQGISYELANLSGMSRQGIDRQIAQGRIIQERNAVKALVLIFQNEFWR